MILDTSALIAILADEADAPRYAGAIGDASGRIALSAATLVELTMVAEGRGGRLAADLEAILTRLRPDVVPVTREQAEIAREGWRRFGKGRHEAALNFGDCFAYALAIARDEPLLFKGEDFARTDVKRAL